MVFKARSTSSTAMHIKLGSPRRKGADVKSELSRTTNQSKIFSQLLHNRKKSTVDSYFCKTHNPKKLSACVCYYRA